MPFAPTGRTQIRAAAVAVTLALASAACSSGDDRAGDPPETMSPDAGATTIASPPDEPDDLPDAVLALAAAPSGKVTVDQRINGEHYLSQGWHYSDGPVLTVAISSPLEGDGTEIRMAYRADGAYFHAPDTGDPSQRCRGWLHLPAEDLSAVGSVDIGQFDQGLAAPTIPFLEELGPLTDQRIDGDGTVWQSTVPADLSLGGRARAALDDDQLDEVAEIDLPVELRVDADEAAFTLEVDESALYDHFVAIGLMEEGEITSSSRTLRHEAWTGTVGDDIPGDAPNYLDCVEAAEADEAAAG